MSTTTQTQRRSNIPHSRTFKKSLAERRETPQKRPQVQTQSQPEKQIPLQTDDEITNQVFLMGSICSEIKFFTTQNDHEVANFTVSTEDSWPDASGEVHSTTNFHHVKAWNKLAAVVKNGLVEGSRVKLKGKLKTNRYGDDEDKKYFTYVHLTQLKKI